MKGVDIVVARLGRPHERVHGADAAGSSSAATPGDALGDSIYEARLYVRGAVAGLGADCVEKELRDEHRGELRELLDARRRSTTSTRRTSAATARRASSTTSTSTTPGAY